MGIAGPQAAHALFPDDQVDGAFAAMVADLDMWAGCPERVAGRPAESQSEPRGFGFWANAMTTQDGRTVPDIRAQLSDVATPVLVLRAECDYLAWEIAREYRDVLPDAVLIPVDAAGHSIAEDRPALFGDLVRRFLGGERLGADGYLEDASPWA